MIFKRLLLFVFLMPVLKVQGQLYYSLTVSSGTYTNLSGATPLKYINTSTDQGYYYSTNLTFPIFSRIADFNTRTTPVTSLGAFLSSSGYMAIYESPGYKNTILIQAFNNSDIIVDTNTTIVSVKVDGPVNDRIHKFEWKNVIYKTSSQKLNLQIWLHEKNGAISFHYGPASFSGAEPSASVGLLVIDSTFANVLDGYCIPGNSISPAPEGANSWSQVIALDDYPAIGTIYMLSPKTTGIVEQTKQPLHIVFPNPAKHLMTIKSDSDDILFLYSADGRVIQKYTTERNKTINVGLNSYSSGVYYLKNENGFSSKILVTP